MEHGFIPAEIRDKVHPLIWVLGDPEWSKWDGNVKTHDRRVWAIMVYRCESCGLLAHYAHEEL
jgi:hypothetical protein